MLLAVQVLVLKVQKEYGVRSILPKFMYFTEFKYFINEPEGSDTKCSICLSLIRELPGDAKGA